MDEAVRRLETVEAISTGYGRVRVDPAHDAYQAGQVDYPQLALTVVDDEPGRPHTFKRSHVDIRLHARAQPVSGTLETSRPIIPGNRGSLHGERCGELAFLPAPDLTALAYECRLLARFDKVGANFDKHTPQAWFASDSGD